MHAIERAEYILAMLEKNKVVMVADLSREMDVTEETVRKDLEKLEKQERLCRVHGGAYLNEGYGNETPVAVRGKIMREEKALLGRRCMELIREKEAVFLDCSTTALYLAKELASSNKKLTVMTNSLAAASELAGNPSVRLIVFGGELNRDRAAFEGESVQRELEQCFIHKAFISSAGISHEAGVTDSTRAEAEIRRAVIRQAKTCILMADSTKIGRNGIYVVGGIEDIDCLVVDRPVEKADPKLWERLELLKIPVIDGSNSDPYQKGGGRRSDGRLNSAKAGSPADGEKSL